MYLFAVFNKKPNAAVLYKLVDPEEKEKIFAKKEVFVKTVKCYPNYKTIKKYIKIANKSYLPHRIGHTNIIRIKTDDLDTLIDVESLSLAKLYIEVNKNELFEHGNLKKKDI